MSMATRISNAEVSSNPATGLVTGDSNPATTQAGVITKLRDQADELAAFIAVLKAIFDPHDHDPANPTGGGGRQIGAGGAVSILADAITRAKIGAGAITYLKVALAAVTTQKIADGTVEKAQVGAPSVKYLSIPAGDSATWTLTGRSGPPLYCVTGDSGDMESLIQLASFSDSTFSLQLMNTYGSAKLNVAIYYRG